MAAQTIDDLLVALGFEYDPKDLEEFEKDISESVAVVKQLITATIGAATAITGMVVASTAASDAQGKLALEIGESVEMLDALQHANVITGGTADGMASSLQQLAIRASEAARGVGSGVEAFGMLGISVTDANGQIKSASVLMSEISARMQGFGNLQQIELADKLGLRDTVRLLQAGPGEMRKLTQEAMLLGVTTAEDAAIAADFQDSLADLWRVVKDGSRLLTRTFAPIIQEIVTSLTDWWKTNRAFIEQNLPAYIERATNAVKLLSIAIGAFLALKLAAVLGSLPALLAAATAWVLRFAASVFTLPVLIGAVISAIALFAQDAKFYFEGHESLIGRLIKQYPEWTTAIERVAAVFATIYDLTVLIFDGWKRILNLDFKKFVSDLPDFLRDQAYGQRGDVDAGETILSTFDPNDIPDIGAVPNVPTTGNTKGGLTVEKVEINVGGSDTPQATATAIMNEFRQASQDLSSMVDQ